MQSIFRYVHILRLLHSVHVYFLHFFYNHTINCIALYSQQQPTAVQSSCRKDESSIFKKDTNYVHWMYEVHWPSVPGVWWRWSRADGDQSPLSSHRFRGPRFGISQWPPPPQSSTTLQTQEGILQVCQWINYDLQFCKNTRLRSDWMTDYWTLWTEAIMSI